MDVTVGESIVLPCQVTHDHSLDIVFTWFFNGHLIDFDRDGDHFERVGGVSINTHTRGATGVTELPRTEPSHLVFKEKAGGCSSWCLVPKRSMILMTAAVVFTSHSAKGAS